MTANGVSTDFATTRTFIVDHIAQTCEHYLSSQLLSIGDHCGQVERACKETESGRGPVTVRTPYGLRVEEWNEGIAKYANLWQE